MKIEKSLLSGNTPMLILSLLKSEDKYGYQMVEELAKRSDDTFLLKEGTLYPLLHTLKKTNWSAPIHVRLPPDGNANTAHLRKKVCSSLNTKKRSDCCSLK